MKRNLWILSVICLLLIAVSSLSACGLFGKGNDTTPASDDQIRAMYTAYAESGGKLSYDEWLALVRGEKGEIGVESDEKIVEVSLDDFITLLSAQSEALSKDKELLKTIITTENSNVVVEKKEAKGTSDLYSLIWINYDEDYERRYILRYSIEEWISKYEQVVQRRPIQPIKDFAKSWVDYAYQENCTIASLIKAIFPDDYSCFFVSKENENKLSMKYSELSGTFYIYSHIERWSGKYWGRLLVENGIITENSTIDYIDTAPTEELVAVS